MKIQQKRKLWSVFVYSYLASVLESYFLFAFDWMLKFYLIENKNNIKYKFKMKKEYEWEKEFLYFYISHVFKKRILFVRLQNKFTF